MRWKVLVSAAALWSMAAPAFADGPTLPTFALTPQPTPSIWSGLYVGTEVFGISGGKHVRGGFGGAADLGYDHEFANNIVVGVRGSAGYTPFHLADTRVRGYDFATADVRVGYDMGRVMPYVTGGVAILKPNLASGLGSLNPGDSFNDLMNGGGALKAAGRIGAGVEYAVTNNLKVGVEVSVTQTPAGRALLLP